MNVLGTKIRDNTPTKIKEIEDWQTANPRGKDESDEDYIMRYCDDHESKFMYYPEGRIQ